MRTMMICGAAIAGLTLAAATPGVGEAHGGGLDANGCHTNRKTGEYHCHRAPAAAAAPAPRANHAPRPVRTGASFANCAAARAAGAAPVRRGDPGYGPHLDRDGDGVGCESR
jgi:hypothetical protein